MTNKNGFITDCLELVTNCDKHLNDPGELSSKIVEIKIIKMEILVYKIKIITIIPAKTFDKTMERNITLVVKERKEN